jgi:hypothetical protein
VFAGYFMKVMTYKASDNTRGAPLLLGRAQMISKPPVTPGPPLPAWLMPLVFAAAVIGCGCLVWSNTNSRRQRKISSLPHDLASDAAPTEGEFDFAALGSDQAGSGQSTHGSTIQLNPIDRFS